MHVTKKNMRVFYRGQYLKKEDSNRLKLYTTLFACSWRVRNLCFISVALMVCVSCAFVCDAVNVNKIAIVSSTKPLSYSYAQVSTGLTLYLG